MENGRNAALNGGRGSGQTVRRITEFYEEKIADLKANFDYILEGKENEYREERKKLCDDFENMKAGLESKIATLGKRCNQLLKDKGNLVDELQELKETLAQTIENDEVNYETLKLHDQEEIGMLNSKIAGLKQQIEKKKSQYDYAFNQLCKSREILCSMLSQYRDRKEIDYSTRECGEKLLKEGVYKND